MYDEDSSQSSKRKREATEDASPSETDRSKSSKVAHLPPSSSSSPSGGDSSNSFSSDDAAIEAAIAVALQLACHTTSAEQILQVRHPLSRPTPSPCRLPSSSPQVILGEASDQSTKLFNPNKE
jgi:hypothetical protein